MKYASPYSFFLQSSLGIDGIEPLNTSSFQVSYNKKDNRAFLAKELRGSLIFRGKDYHFLKQIKDTGSACEVVTLSIVKDCGDQPLQGWNAKLSLNSGTWNEDQCIVELSPVIEDKYACIDDNKDEEFNLFDYIIEREEIPLLVGQLETILCNGTVGVDPVFCGDDIADGWVLYADQEVEDTSFGGNTTFSKGYAREVITSATPMPLPWIEIGANQYARKPFIFGRKSSQIQIGFNIYTTTSWRLGGDGVTSFDNGMSLRKVFEFFLDRACPNLILRSDFFQWNPDIASNINYVTQEPSEVLNLILYQKSDIKRPEVSGNATVANLTFESLLKDICNMFNLKWDIVSDEFDIATHFVIEHVSYFNRGVGLNLVDRQDKNLRAGTRVYSYDLDELPKREIFQMPDNKARPMFDFTGLPIIYNNECAGQGDKKEEVYQVENIVTDILYTLSNSESDSTVVSDDGFVLIACDANNQILYTAPILDPEAQPNNVLAWAQLQERYWKHQRPMKEMNMNGIEQEAITVKPTINQTPLNVSICCGESFDPEDKVVSELGEGFVKSATYSVFAETLTLELGFTDIEP